MSSACVVLLAARLHMPLVDMIAMQGKDGAWSTSVLSAPAGIPFSLSMLKSSRKNRSKSTSPASPMLHRFRHSYSFLDHKHLRSSLRLCNGCNSFRPVAAARSCALTHHRTMPEQTVQMLEQFELHKVVIYSRGRSMAYDARRRTAGIGFTKKMMSIIGVIPRSAGY
jgi:hypothetical protein